MTTRYIVLLILLYPVFSIAQNTKELEKLLLGRWAISNAATIQQVPDSLYSSVQLEDIRYLYFGENNKAQISYDSNRNDYNGNYKVVFDKKSKSVRIQLKENYGSCAHSYIDVISVEDTTLVIRSCVNLINLVLIKAKPAENQIKEAKTKIQGKWKQVDLVHTCQIPDSIRDQFYRYDNVESLEFQRDSVIILFKSDPKPITAEYVINYNLRFDIVELDIPIFRGQITRLGGLPIKKLDKHLVLPLVDCDYSQITFARSEEEKK